MQLSHCLRFFTKNNFQLTRRAIYLARTRRSSFCTSQKKEEAVIEEKLNDQEQVHNTNKSANVDQPSPHVNEREVSKEEADTNFTLDDSKMMRKNKQISLKWDNHEDESELIPEQYAERYARREAMLRDYEQFKDYNRWGEFYRVYGVVLLWLGLGFLAVPFYKVICETRGKSLKTTHKSYQFSSEKVNILRKYKVVFLAQIEDGLDWTFVPTTKEVVINGGETCLAFYRAYNHSEKPIVGLSIYQVAPDEVAMYFNKIQCFCFENQMLNPGEYVDLPVLFYLDPAINSDPDLRSTQVIYLTYHFYPSKSQNLATVIEEELKKHENEQGSLKSKKEDFKLKGIEFIDKPLESVAQPGLSPLRKSERALRQLKEMNAKLELEANLAENPAFSPLAILETEASTDKNE